tara:strand:- start:373 stop:912 length:540 start_codon:yes stop_codon:yes gene_type:complete
MSNLRLINETTASSVSNLDITDVFTSDFDIYKIEIEVDDYDANSKTTIRFINSSGSVVSSTDYDNALLYRRTDSTYNELRSTSDNVLFERFLGFFDYNNGSRQGGAGIFYVFQPTNPISYTFALGQSQNDFSTGKSGGMTGIGVLHQKSMITGFQFLQDGYSATFGEIKVRCYGLRVDT